MEDQNSPVARQPQTINLKSPSGRHLSEAQRMEFLDALSQYRCTKVRVAFMPGDFEGKALANQLIKSFQEAGWNCPDTPTILPMEIENPPLVEIWAEPAPFCPTVTSLAAGALVKFLDRHGLNGMPRGQGRTTFEGDPKEIVVRIGPLQTT
jgi:hypothetical protein